MKKEDVENLMHTGHRESEQREIASTKLVHTDGRTERETYDENIKLIYLKKL